MPDITIAVGTIPEAKVDEFQAGFLARRPIPLDAEGNPQYNPKQWLEYYLRQVAINDYRTGKRMLARQAAVIDEDVISTD